MSFRLGRIRVSNRGVSARFSRVRVGRGWRTGGRGLSGALAALGENYVSTPPRDLSVDELEAVPDEIKERAWDDHIAELKDGAQDEWATVEAMSDEEVETELAAEFWMKRRRNEAEFELYLASLPLESREMIERIMHEHPA